MKMCRESANLVKNLSEMSGTLHEDLSSLVACDIKSH